MSGPLAVNHLLSNYLQLTTVVPAARILNGVLPLDTPLPAIGVMSVSGVPRNTVAMTESTGLVTERVQVTVQADSYGEQKALIRLVVKACPNQRGTINGVAVDSIVPDVEGPDIEEADENRYTQSIDFIVRWKRER